MNQFILNNNIEVVCSFVGKKKLLKSKIYMFYNLHPLAVPTYC